MKVQVITDAQGNILATAPVMEMSGEDGPVQAALTAGPNQLLHEFEVGEDFVKLRPEEIHYQFRVELQAVTGKLVDVAKKKDA